MTYDLIIIGGGPAGITAGIYAVRKKIKTLLLAKQLGGQPTEAWQIENYPGFESILGVDLAKKFVDHLLKFKDEIEIKEGEAVIDIQKLSDGEFKISTDKNKYQAKSIIIASGTSPRKLGVVGEEEFKNRGVVYCATCDAPLFKNKIVSVVGAGNSALDAALQLTKYASKIYLFNKYPSFNKADKEYVDEVKAAPAITILNNARVKKIRGGKFVNSLVWENTETHEIQEVETDGVFVEIGSKPSLQFARDLVEFNERGEIIVDLFTNMTTVPGIFAAGDVTNNLHKQIVIAAGEGAKATLSTYQYLTKIK
ncbi:MAG: FAD-dependent oxidoreductase [Candidatus Portnoybacteria bacterium]|nr:FAD-dependent oxidoreductase [Candidatus Portnoybacteria bacterium]